MHPECTQPIKIQALEALERQHNLFSFRIDGWSAWRVMRNPVHRMTMGLPLAQPTKSDATRSLRALGATLKLLWLLVVGGRRELLVKTCRSGLRMQQGERFRDVYFDGLLQRGYSYLKLEEVNSPDFDKQAAAAWLPSELDPVVFTFWGRILGLLFPVKARSFCELVAELLRQEVQLSVTPNWLLMRISTVYWQSRVYSALLARIAPRAVLVSDTGDYALRIACHRRSVRFIELQHGVFDATHPDAVPLWAEGSTAELVLPDILACRGDFWVDQLASTKQGGGLALAVGNELIDFARVRKQSQLPKDHLKLVLTSQGLDSERLARWIAEMIAAAPSTIDWQLSIKLHPVYDAGSDAFEELITDSRVIVIGGAEQPNVFDLLAEADLHLSIASACHFDAAALGIPSVVVPLAGHEAMLNVIDSLQIFIVQSPADIWSIVSEKRTVAQIYSNRFAKPDFVMNLQKLVP